MDQRHQQQVSTGRSPLLSGCAPRGTPGRLSTTSHAAVAGFVPCLFGVVAAVAVVGCTLESTRDAAPGSARTAAPLVAQAGDLLAHAQRAADHPTLAGTPRRLDCPYRPTSLRFLPGGDGLLVSGPKLSGLAVVDLGGGPARVLSDDPGAGVGVAVASTADALVYHTRPGHGQPEQLRSVPLDGSAPPQTLINGARLGYPVSDGHGGLLVTLERGLLSVPQPGHAAVQGRAAGGLELGAMAAAATAPQAAFPLDAPPAGATWLADRVDGRRLALTQAGGERWLFVDHGHFVLRLPLGADWRARREVVSSGTGFYLGDAAPDGHAAILHESRGPHGWLHVAEAGGGPPRELTWGHAARWLGPRAIVFERVEHDTRQVTAADIWWIPAAGGVAAPLIEGGERIPVSPVADATGRRLAFVDAADGGLYVVELRWREAQP